jgi:hypothetical protein
VVRRTWTELPIPSEVIDRVSELATNESDHVDYQHEIDELDEEVETEQRPEVEQEQEPGPSKS